MARIERLALALGLDPFDVSTDIEFRRRQWGMALGVDLLTDLPSSSSFPERWTTKALLDELERRQEPESRHKLKPTKLAGKSLSELREINWRSISDDMLKWFSDRTLRSSMGESEIGRDNCYRSIFNLRIPK